MFSANFQIKGDQYDKPRGVNDKGCPEFGPSNNVRVFTVVLSDSMRYFSCKLRQAVWLEDVEEFPVIKDTHILTEKRDKYPGKFQIVIIAVFVFVGGVKPSYSKQQPCRQKIDNCPTQLPLRMSRDILSRDIWTHTLVSYGL